MDVSTLDINLIYWIYLTHYLFLLGQVWYLIVSIPDLCTITYLIRQIYFERRATDPNRSEELPITMHVKKQ